MFEGARCPPKYLAWSAAPSAVKLVDPPQAYSPLVLSDFNEEKMLVEETDEVSEKVPQVAGELG